MLEFTLRFTINARTCFGLPNHHQGAYSLCFAKVIILASVKILRYRTVWSWTGLIWGHTTEQFYNEVF